MGANIFVENSINIHDLSSQIIGDGWLEQSCSISGHLEGRFFVGAYSLVSQNTVQGKFMNMPVFTGFVV